MNRIRASTDEDTGYYEERCSLVPSISTNATADNNPGAGRTLGKLYNLAGRKLENGLNPILKKLRKDGRTERLHQEEPRHRHQSHSNEDEESDLDYRMEQCSLASTLSSNATADSLPGAGRTIGAFYTSAGKQLETKLGQLAEKLGKGPHETAVRIQRRRLKALRLPPHSKKIEQKNAKVRRDCKKLLKYVQSATPSTQIQALGYVISLTVEDPFVRDTLLLIRARHIIEPLQIWNPFKAESVPTLLNRSRKALLSLEDTQINTLAHVTEAWTFEGSDWPYSQLTSLAEYLNDPERAFLVIRHIKRMLDKLILGRHIYAPEIVHSTINFSELPREFIEWTFLDPLISGLLNYLTLKRNWQVFNLPPLLAFILRNADRLPETTGSEFFRWISAFDATENAVDKLHVYLSRCLMRGIALANGFEDDANFQVNLAYLQELYPCPSVLPILRRITCPSELILTDFVTTIFNFQDSKFTESAEHTIALDLNYLENVCGNLAQLVDSDHALLSGRALRAFNYIITVDNYCRNEALRVLQTTRIAQTITYAFLLEDSMRKCVPRDRLWGDTETTVRHCDANGTLLHIHQEKYKWTQVSGSYCNVLEGNEQVLEFQRKDVLELHIPRGTAFSATGHHPISAGITADGSYAYIAQALSRSDSRGGYIAITEGTKPEDLRMSDRRTGMKNVVPMYLVVYVLRYSPAAYTRCERLMGYLCEGDVGLHATGPYSWKAWAPDSSRSGHTD